ncbi:MAG: hypothetical protein V2B18_21655 [Pseudomonadota bacterium]
MRTLVVAAITVILIAGFGAASSAPITEPTVQEEDFRNSFGDFDLRACEDNCRERFGYQPYELELHGRGSGRSANRVYAQCILDCNRRFWKDFDKETQK